MNFDDGPAQNHAVTRDAALRELGHELRIVRTETLKNTGPQMAQWLGLSTRGPRGRLTSTGKSLVSQYESGRRLPDAAVIAQYCRAPGARVGRIQQLHARAVELDGASRTRVRQPKATASVAASGAPSVVEKPPAPPTPRRRRLVYVVGAAAVIAAAVVALLMVGSTGSRPVDRPVAGVQLVFDALGPNSDQTINVYPGYTTGAADRKSDLAYHSGERAAVICEVHGRWVTSDPSAGETYRTTDLWARIRTSRGLIRYATMTYARLDPSTANVPACPR